MESEASNIVRVVASPEEIIPLLPLDTFERIRELDSMMVQAGELRSWAAKARRAAFIRLKQEGYGATEIGRMLGMTRSRVYMLWQDALQNNPYSELMPPYPQSDGSS